MSVWRVEFLPKAEKQLEKLGKQKEKQIKDFLVNKILALDAPTQKGKALTANKKGLWRYRVDDIRIVCEFQNDKLIILVLEVGHRSKIYL